MKKFDAMTLVKLGVAVAGAGITLAQSYFDRKDLDAKVAEKVAEALKQQGKES